MDRRPPSDRGPTGVSDGAMPRPPPAGFEALVALLRTEFERLHKENLELRRLQPEGTRASSVSETRDCTSSSRCSSPHAKGNKGAANYNKLGVNTAYTPKLTAEERSMAESPAHAIVNVGQALPEKLPDAAPLTATSPSPVDARNCALHGESPDTNGGGNGSIDHHSSGVASAEEAFKKIHASLHFHSQRSRIEHFIRPPHVPTPQPEKTNFEKLRDWMTKYLDLIIGILILLNTFVLVIQLERDGSTANISLGLEPEGYWEGSDPWFSFFDHWFNAVFAAELVLRVCVFGFAYFKDFTNWLDVALVVGTTMSLYLVKMEHNMLFARLVRLSRLVKTLRVVRVMKLCSKLRVLVFTLMSCFPALASSMLVLFVMMLIGAMFMCQSLHSFITEPDADLELRLFANNRFGSIGKALYTMFEITFAGNWPVTVRPIVHDISALYACFFVPYIAGVVFAVVRIITALFLKDTLQIAQNDQEMMVMSRAAEKATLCKKLGEVFRQADVTQDGLISYEEFEKCLEVESVATYLSLLELDLHETRGLFDLLDDGDGFINLDEFVYGIMRLKGFARSQDVVAISHDNQKLMALLRKNGKYLAYCEQSLRELLKGGRLCSHAGSSEEVGF